MDKGERTRIEGANAPSRCFKRATIRRLGRGSAQILGRMIMILQISFFIHWFFCLVSWFGDIMLILQLTKWIFKN